MSRGDRLRTLRLDQGVRLSHVAEVLAVHPSTIWRWESGEVVPTDDQVMAYVDACHLPPIRAVEVIDNAAPAADLPGDTGLYWARSRDGEWYPALVVWWGGRLQVYAARGDRQRLEDFGLYVTAWRGPLLPPVDP